MSFWLQDPLNHSNARTEFFLNSGYGSELWLTNIRQEDVTLPGPPGSRTVNPILGSYQLIRSIDLYFGATLISTCQQANICGALFDILSVDNNSDRQAQYRINGSAVAQVNPQTFLLNSVDIAGMLVRAKCIGSIQNMKPLELKDDSVSVSCDLGKLFPILRSGYIFDFSKLKMRIIINWQDLTQSVVGGAATDKIDQPILLYSKFDSDKDAPLPDMLPYTCYESDAFPLPENTLFNEYRLGNLSGKYIEEVTAVNYLNQGLHGMFSNTSYSNVSADGQKICASNMDTAGRRMGLNSKKMASWYGNHVDTTGYAEKFGTSLSKDPEFTYATDLCYRTSCETFDVNRKCGRLQCTIFAGAGSFNGGTAMRTYIGKVRKLLTKNGDFYESVYI